MLVPLIFFHVVRRSRHRPEKRTFPGKSSSFVRRPLDSLFTGFVGANTKGFVDIVHKYFAVSDFAGLR
jgi:hypothetical protein